MEPDLKPINIRAAASNNESEVKRLIDADVNMTDEEGKTALLYAVQQSNNENVVHALINAGANVNMTDKERKTALSYAVQQSNNEIVVGALINAGANVNMTDKERKTALSYAVRQSNNGNVVGALIDAGADVNMTDEEGKTAWFYAVQQSNNENVVRVLIDAGADVNMTDEEGKTALLYAVQQSNNENVVRVLIDAGADSVKETDNQGKTALFYAAQNNNEGIAVLLIDAGADVDAKDNQDKTPLFYTAANTCTEDASGTLTALVEKGDACVDAPDIYGRTPLFYAITESIACARYLLDNEGDKDAEDKCNVSILTYAVEHCLMKSENSTYLSDVLSLLAEKGLEKKSIVQSMLNLVFCKAPLLLGSDEKAIPGLNIKKEDILKTLAVAIQYVDESCIEKKEKILKVEEKIRSGEIFEALDLLRKLQARPNSTDSAGNTALHYATALPLMGVPQESVMRTCKFLRKGANFSKPNHQSQTPLLFCLSPNNWTLTSPSNQISGSKTLVDVCAFLLRNGSKLNETLKSKENVFHLLINLFQQVLDLHDKVVRESVLQELIKLLDFFVQKGKRQGKIGNDHNENGNSPLRLWATLTLPSPQDYSSDVCENYTFEKFLKFLLDSLVKCGANMNDRNHRNETPLHVCKTWTAVKLLLDAGANPNDLDSSGRSPLLVAAKSGFYPDVAALEDPKCFWKNAVEMGLDPYTINSNGEFVLYFLLETNFFALAKALVDVACEENFVQGARRYTAILDALRKVESPSAHSWKQALLEVTSKSRNCNSGFEETKDGTEHERQESIEIALKTESVADSTKAPRDSDTKSLDEANTATVEVEPSKLTTKRRFAKSSDWSPVSEKHKEKLENVFNKPSEMGRVQTISYHKEPIAHGAFGFVFVGLDENDGREVAIKRIQNHRVNEEEMKNLTRLADCEQVVKYLYYVPEDDFSYIVLELMEGTLDEYLHGRDFDKSTSVQLCKDVVMGLRFLHGQHIPIIHRDLKPANILYKTHPKLCLKIADFGLSLLVHSSCDEGKKRQVVGTRCWRAPEVIKASNTPGSGLESADIFSCGLLLHYILSKRKHPFSPDDLWDHAFTETETNIMEGVLKGWDYSLSSESTHLVKRMLESNEKERPSAEEALKHPFFWSKDKKIDLLVDVGNQLEFACSQDACSTAVLKNLNKTTSTIFKGENWNDQRYSHMPAIFHELIAQEGDSYDTGSVVDLVRFIRCAYTGLPVRSELIKRWICEDFVFLKYFPDLVTEVYKTVTDHGWEKTKDAIKSTKVFSQKVSSTPVAPPSVHLEKLEKVARGKECKEVDQYSYHQDPIATGQFGQIFAGINKRDGRKVAIKRIDKMRIQKPEDRREIRNLTLLADCGQVVFYVSFFETENFSFVILELMEGNLDELLDGEFDKSKSVQLYKDVVEGIKYLHKRGILHRDLKPGNILYKVHPKLCLKLADFGLSRRIDSTSSVSVCGNNVETPRCWIAPEVLRSSSNYSKSSDNFSCGLIAFYIFSLKRHPFSPVHSDNENPSSTETEANIMKGVMEGWDDSLSPEATHLLEKMLDSDPNQRPSAEEALKHPLFWPNQEKIDFLKGVGNRPEFECPYSKRNSTSLEEDLEKRSSTIVKYASWNDSRYEHMPTLYTEMTKKRKDYHTESIVDLVRFVRNAYQNVSEETRPSPIRRLLLEDFVFLKYFPDLMVEVYKAVISSRASDETKGEIPQAEKYANQKHVPKDASGSSYFVEQSSTPPKVKMSASPSLSREDHLPFRIETNDMPIVIRPWCCVSVNHEHRLAAVARGQDCKMVHSFWLHKDPIGNGSFGHIFAGINEKDGREVAIKRIEKLRMQRQEDKREILNLTTLADCEQVVRYISFFEEGDFSYVVLELMEGNLEEYLNGSTIDATQATLLCTDVVMGLRFLHKHKILHRDLKPQNILYKVHPRVCLKIADFGLSRVIDSACVATTVYGTIAGTRCWMAPELLTSKTTKVDKNRFQPASDMFSCGMLLHYILSGQKHPFNPADCAMKSELQVANETEANIMKGVMEGWDDSLSPEATHLLKKMLAMDDKERPSAEDAHEHPLFWTRNKKIDLLVAVGNEPEFECPRTRRTPLLTPVETDLENSFGAIVRHGSWNDGRYLHMPDIYKEMTTGRGRKKYETWSDVELVRFIRNAYAHISLGSRTTPIKRLLLEDFVFLEYFPDLLMEVYKAVTTHGWDETREEIKYVLTKM